MNNRPAISEQHQIYSKRYFDASPTWYAWNKLTAADVHALQQKPGFEGQQIYFHWNHPIRFVRLVGIVVDIVITTGAKHILISLDDSSGACIEIKTSVRELKSDDHAEYPSNTVIDNVDVYMNLGVATVLIDKKPIDIGSIIKAKGTINSFRNQRQLKLERIWIVKDTNEEAKAWAETAEWKRDILSKPWILTKQQKDDIDEQIRRDEAKEREKSRKRKMWDAKYAEKRKKHLAKHEARRKRHEEKLDMGALRGSNAIPMRMTDS